MRATWTTRWARFTPTTSPRCSFWIHPSLHSRLWRPSRALRCLEPTAGGVRALGGSHHCGGSVWEGYPPIEMRRDWRVPPCDGRRLPCGGRIMLRADAFERASAWSSVRARRLMERARGGRSRRANAGGRAPPARALELPWAEGRPPLGGGQQGADPGGPGSGNGNRPLCIRRLCNQHCRCVPQIM